MKMTCFYCATPFVMTMDEKRAAIREMWAANRNYFDVHCPACGKVNPISRMRLELFTSGWEDAIIGIENGSASHPVERIDPSDPVSELRQELLKYVRELSVDQLRLMIVNAEALIGPLEET